MLIIWTHRVLWSRAPGVLEIRSPRRWESGNNNWWNCSEEGRGWAAAFGAGLDSLSSPETLFLTKSPGAGLLGRGLVPKSLSKSSDRLRSPKRGLRNTVRPFSPGFVWETNISWGKLQRKVEGAGGVQLPPEEPPSRGLGVPPTGSPCYLGFLGALRPERELLRPRAPRPLPSDAEAGRSPL